MARKSRKNVENTAIVRNDPFIHTALYIRLSVEDSKNRGNSIENQQLIISDYISDKPEFKVYGTYIDNGLTGTNFDRPEFQRMLSDIENGHINCVIVKDLSRLGRNAIDTGYYIEQYFPKNKVRFIAVTDNYDSEFQSNSSAIMLPLKNMINEAYALDIGRKIRSQAHQAMLDGDFLGARAPFGYRKDPDNCHKLLIDEVTAPIVRQMFEWSAAGIGVNVIAKNLNEMQAVTASEYKQATTEPNKNYKHSRYWNTYTVLHILDNPVYTGDLEQGKSKTVDHKQIDLSPDEYIIVRGTHEPIVSREMFEKAKAFRKSVCEAYKQKPIDHYTENIFKGKIFCADCGKPIHRERRKCKTKADTYYLHCIANSRIAKGICKGAKINETELIELISAGIKEIVDYLAVSSADCIVAKKKCEKLNKSIAEYQTEADKVQGFIRSLYENYVEGIISGEDYVNFKSEYGEKLASLNEKIILAKSEISELENSTKTRTNLIESTKSFKKNGVLTAELIGLFVKRIEVTDEHTAIIEYNFDIKAQKEAI